MKKKINIAIFLKGTNIKIKGHPNQILSVRNIFKLMLNDIKKRGFIKIEDLEYYLKQVSENSSFSEEDADKSIINVPKAGKVIRPRTPNQLEYLKNIDKHDIVFSIGPAGTGKTYLAVAKGIEAIIKGDKSRLVLTRPVVEAGESLGFLPGDLQQKINPYLRPLFDAIWEMLPFEDYQNYKEKEIIEIAPLAYMRGRTLNNCFVILDEAQNTTIGQMKMFLTRLGGSSQAVITGDTTQIDLPKNTPSGLLYCQKILRNIDELSFNYLDKKDIVRHPLVKKIVEAFEKDNKK